MNNADITNSILFSAITTYINEETEFNTSQLIDVLDTCAEINHKHISLETLYLLLYIYTKQKLKVNIKTRGYLDSVFYDTLMFTLGTRKRKIGKYVEKIKEIDNCESNVYNKF